MIVIPRMDGVEAPDQLADAFGRDHVTGGARRPVCRRSNGAARLLDSLEQASPCPDRIPPAAIGNMGTS
jgi:hypothetical protein